MDLQNQIMTNPKIIAARIALGGFIQERREQMGATVEQLAKHVDVTANTINGVENGRFAMDIDLQFLIYEALEIKPYFSVTQPPDDDDYRDRAEDDPERYHGFYITENLLLYPGQLAITKLTHPRMFVRFNYGQSYFSSFDDWVNNHTELSWLDPEDKPTDKDEEESILIDCWNFLALHERKEEELYNDDTDD